MNATTYPLILRALSASPSPGGHPDAALIALCAAHPSFIDAVNNDPDGDLSDDDPIWMAYSRSRDAIAEAKPATVEGMLAKARAAKAEARNKDGTETHTNCPAENWSWDLVNDLLRISAEPAPDAALLGLIDQWHALEDQSDAVFTEHPGGTNAEEVLRDALIEPIRLNQAPLEREIVRLQANTAQGVAARLGMLGRLDPDFAKPEGEDADMRLLAASVRDAIAERAHG